MIKMKKAELTLKRYRNNSPMSEFFPLDAREEYALTREPSDSHHGTAELVHSPDLTDRQIGYLGTAITPFEALAEKEDRQNGVRLHVPSLPLTQIAQLCNVAHTSNRAIA